VDAVDLAILALLAQNARVTFSELAVAVALSGPSTADRVRRLEERGAIRGYSARISPEALGLELTALVAVTLAGPEYRAAFLARLGELPGVVECHHVAGDYDYLVKVHVAGTRGLETFVSDGLKSVSGVAKTHTTVVLSTPLDRPLSPEADGE
jgi:Lrp/AsnC family leucine-responsive transcriptional regulator